MPEWLKSFASGNDRLSKLVQAVSGIITLSVTIKSFLGHDLQTLIISGVLLLGTVVWATWRYILKWVRPIPISASARNTDNTLTTYLRGLLPFQAGDKLFGRDHEIRQLITILRSDGFRFAYISGDAGAGKTSLLRAEVTPTLQKEWEVIYVDRTGGDPEKAIWQKIIQRLTVLAKQVNEEASDESLLKARANLDKFTSLKEVALTELIDYFASETGKKVLIVLDQFEEFFLVKRSIAERESFAVRCEELNRLMIEKGLPLKVLFSLRKEFVDDLLDIETFNEQKGAPIFDLKFRFQLRNWTYDVAHDVLKKVVEVEGLRFSPELQSDVIRDLTSSGLVRPVEFQLVLTRLNALRVYDSAKYTELGGARGIMSDFIREIIGIGGQNSQDIDNSVAKFVLRALCDEGLQARRPIGLELTELTQIVIADYERSQHLSKTPTTNLRSAVKRIVNRLRENFILIEEDGTRLNLAHDYLVPAVRDATADIETVEEEANRLLEQYVDQNQRGLRTSIPYKHYKFIKSFASAENIGRAFAQRLLKRARLRLAGFTAICIALGLILPAFLTPFGPVYITNTIFVENLRWNLSEDNSTAVSQNDEIVTFWDLKSPQDNPIEVKEPLERVWISNSGDAALGINANGQLFRMLKASNFEAQDIGLTIDLTNLRGRRKGIGISPNGKWFYAQNESGDIYVWPPNGSPKIIAKTDPRDFFGRTKEELAKRYPKRKFQWEDHQLYFDPQEENIFIYLQDGGLLRTTIDGVSNKMTEITLGLAEPSNYNPILFLHDGDQFLVSDPKGRFSLWQNSQSPQKLSTVNVFERDQVEGFDDDNEADYVVGRGETPDWKVSSDSKWIVARHPFSNFHSVKVQNNTLIPTVGASIELPQSSSDSSSKITFSTNNHIVTGQAQDGALYMWQLDNPPRSTAKPIEMDFDSPGFGGPLGVSRFAPNTTAIAIIANDGSISLRSIDQKTGDVTDTRVLGRILSVDPTLQFDTTSSSLLATNSEEIKISESLEGFESILNCDSDIEHVVSIHGDSRLVALCRNHIVQIEKWFYVYGFRVKKLTIPDFVNQ